MTMTTMTKRDARICSIEGCERKHMARGWCSLHYGRMRVTRPCSVNGCEVNAWSRDLCNAHYQRWRHHGSTGDAPVVSKRPSQLCEIRDCDRVAKAQGLCNSHYQDYRMNKHVDTAEYNAAYDKQKGLCAICQQVPRARKRRGLHADHDHATGVFRGLLCSSCNVALGHLHDDADVAQAAADYLRINRG